ncbi:hypothetical protein SEA_PHARAOH_56 [Mycobacterium phage Pharaoh]|uniref:Uncharacterized protein n=1 Tax=Mycobacterium phage Pharaoh TaxID=2530140 RepID=A0A481W267_9CAUD|nr:hypothetical protein KIV59_gp34 [Mycobacterium phage Pharaoh]QBJ00244.1 hypothetical protein SEA_PHARAOH_56 [Mycobacterium phage Pharaoh]
MDKPKYYRIDVVVRAEIPEDTDALATYVQRRLEEALLTVPGEVAVYEVSH